MHAVRARWRVGAFIFATLWACTGPVPSEAPRLDRSEPAERPLRAAGVPEGWLEQATEAIRVLEYQFSPHANGGWTAPNRAQNLRSRIGGEGLHLTSRTGERDWQVSMRLERFGRKGAERAVEAGEAMLRDGRVEIHREGLPVVEWYLNDERGLEQGFTIDSRPEGAHTRPLVISLVIVPSAPVPEAGETTSVTFRDPERGMTLRYGRLAAVDANGVKLPASLRTASGRLEIEVDDQNAVYPLEIDPLMTSPDWTAGGISAVQWGFSMTTAGDVNGDGYSEVLIGAPDFEWTEGRGGAAFLFLGSANGLSNVADWFGRGGQDGARFGESAAAAGDVNGDGYDDILIGAPTYDSPLPRQDSGAAFLWFGGPASPSNPTGLCPGCVSSPASVADWKREHSIAGDGFGSAVVGAGDVNGDGYADIAIGARGEQGNLSGWVRVFHGGPSGPSAAPDWDAGSPLSGQQGTVSGFGDTGTLAAAGDVNADGFDDLLVGAPRTFGGGRVYLFPGSPTGLVPVLPGGSWWDPDDFWNALAAPEDVATGLVEGRFGASVAGAGDIDADGYADILIGSSDYGSFREGRVVAYRGGPAGLEAAPAWQVEGNAPQRRLGWSVATAGDLNGDGIADIAATAPGYLASFPGPEFEGAAYVWLSTAQGVDPTRFNVRMANRQVDLVDLDLARMLVATAGDVDGDGFGELLVSSADLSDVNDIGTTDLFRGSASGLLGGVGALPPGELAAGDVNGDGFADTLVGAPDFDAGSGDEGMASLYLGGPGGLGVSPSPAWTVTGDQAGARLGETLAVVGDVDGDGYQDVVIGAPGHDILPGQPVPFVDVGKLELYLGQSGSAGLSSTRVWQGFGTKAGEALGSSLASAGDVNGDGLADVVAGAPGYSNGQANEGRTVLYMGLGNAGLTAIPAWSAEGNQAQGAFGFSVDTAGDVNGDGYSDFIVSAPGQLAGQAVGRAFVYHGSADFVSNPPAPAWQTPDDALSPWGHPVSTAGDVNGDGFSDVLIGAPSLSVGVVTLHLGSASGLGVTPAFDQLIPAPAIGQLLPSPGGPPPRFGAGLSSAGDVNGDGFDDVAIAAPDYLTCREVTCSSGIFPTGLVGLYLGASTGLSGPAWFRPVAQEVGLGLYRSLRTLAAGDVDGNGYSDLLVGGSTRTYAFGGNFRPAGGPAALPRTPLQAEDVLVPLNQFGPPVARFGETQGKLLLQMQPWLPGGRTDMQLEFEMKPVGTPFDGTGLLRGTRRDSGSPIILPHRLASAIATLANGAAYHWRVRTVTSSPLFPRSPWFNLGAGSHAETSMRTRPPTPVIGDADSDGASDEIDNCILSPNGIATPDAGGNIQLDTDQDGFGNACDCDFDQDGFCSIADFNVFLPAFQSTVDPGNGTDMNGDGAVGIADFNAFLPGFQAGAPGPSGLVP